MAPTLMWRQLNLGLGQTIRSEDIPKPRHGHRAVVIHDLIVVFGGGNDGVVEELHVFNTSNNLWFKPAVKGDIPRGYAAHGFLVDGTLMLMYGGMMEYGKYSNDLYALEATRWEWKQLKPRSPRNARPPCHRLGHSFNLVNKRVYLFGGLSNDSGDPRINHPKYLNDLYTLDRNGNSVAWNMPNTIGPRPSPRESHSGVAYSNKQDGKSYLVIYGGMNGVRLDDVWMLDCESMSWSNPLPGGCAPLARSLHCASMVGGSMYVLGGWVGGSWPRAAVDDDSNPGWHCTDVLSRLDLDSMTWENIETEGGDGKPPPRAGSIMVNVDSRQYVWSGRDGYKCYLDKQVCFDDMWYIEVDIPQPPGRAQLVKTETNALELSWPPPGRVAELYRVEVMLYSHPPPTAPVVAGGDAAGGGVVLSSPRLTGRTIKVARPSSEDERLISPIRAAYPGLARMVNPESAKKGSPGSVLMGSPGLSESPGWVKKQSPGSAKKQSPGSAKKGSPGLAKSPGRGKKRSPGSTKKGSSDLVISPGWCKKGKPGSAKKESPGSVISPGYGKKGRPGPVKKEKNNPSSSKQENPGPSPANPARGPSPPKSADIVHGLVHLPAKPPPPAAFAASTPVARGVRMLSTRPPAPPLWPIQPSVPLTLGQAQSVIASYRFPAPARMPPPPSAAPANPPHRLVRMTNLIPRGSRGGPRPRGYGPRAPRKQNPRVVRVLLGSGLVPPLTPIATPATSKPIMIRLTADVDGNQVLTMATTAGFRGPGGILKGIVPAAPGQPRVLVVPRAQPAFASTSSEEAATVAAAGIEPPPAAVSSNAGEGCVAAPEGAAALGAAEPRTVLYESNPSEGGFKTETTEGVKTETTEGVKTETTQRVKTELTEGVNAYLAERVKTGTAEGAKTEPLRGVTPRLIQGVKLLLTQAAKPQRIQGDSPRPIQGVRPRPIQGSSPRLIHGISLQLIEAVSPRPIQGVLPRPIQGLSPRLIQGINLQLINGVSPRPIQGLSPQLIQGINLQLINGVSPRPIQGLSPRLIQGINLQLIEGSKSLSEGGMTELAQGVGPRPIQGVSSPPNQGFGSPPNQGVSPWPIQVFSSPPNQGFGSPPNQGVSPWPIQGFSSPPNQGFGSPPNQGVSPRPIQGFSSPPNQGVKSSLNQGVIPRPIQGASTPPNKGVNPQKMKSCMQSPIQEFTHEPDGAATEPTQGVNVQPIQGAVEPRTEETMAADQIERGYREADHDYVLHRIPDDPSARALPGPPSTVKIAKLYSVGGAGGGGGGGGARLTWFPNASDSAVPLDYSVYMAVRSLSSPSAAPAPARLAFARVYSGAQPRCVVAEQVLGNAHLDTRGRPALVFRIQARNAAGTGAATQVKWLQTVAVGEGRRAGEDGDGGVGGGGQGREVGDEGLPGDSKVSGNGVVGTGEGRKVTSENGEEGMGDGENMASKIGVEGMGDGENMASENGVAGTGEERKMACENGIIGMGEASKVVENGVEGMGDGENMASENGVEGTGEERKMACENGIIGMGEASKVVENGVEEEDDVIIKCPGDLGDETMGGKKKVETGNGEKGMGQKRPPTDIAEGPKTGEKKMKIECE